MKKNIFTVVFLFFAIYSMNAQDRMLTHMHSVPQANQNNPAFTVPYKFYIGFPGLSSMNVNFQNPFAYGDIIKRRSDDSLYVDQQSFLKVFSKNNLTSLDLKVNILDFGFRVKNNFFTFSQSVRTNFDFSYPGDMFTLLINGNTAFLDEDKALEMKKLRINASVFSESAIGYQRNLTNRINIGIRAKYLQGFANVNTENSYFYLHTNPDNYFLTVKSEFDVNIASVVDADGNFDQSDLYKNRGFAFDFGSVYRFSDELAVGASVHDLGFIHWNTNAQQFSTNMVNDEFTFKGFDLSHLFAGNQINSGIIQEVADTLSDQFNFSDTTRNSYTTWLNPKVCFDAYYILKTHNKFGGYLRTDFVNGIMLPSLTVSYQRSFGRIFQIGASYGISKAQWSKLGLALSLKLGPCHGFITTENVFSFTNATKTKNLYVHFGTNIVIGKWQEALLDKNRTSIDF